jgi:putative hydrolase of the HAD superfamily
MIGAVVFDFGGVLAEEGFREGLKTIAREKGLKPEEFYRICSNLVYQTGYIIGTLDEHSYWEAVREKTGIRESDRVLREEILKRFELRPEMLNLVDRLKSSGLITAILSDQTNWLEELNQRTPFYDHFDYVFNSFHLKKTKRGPSIFQEICKLLSVRPEEILFTDDNLENIKRASGQGLETIEFKGVTEFRKEIEKWVGPL